MTFDERKTFLKDIATSISRWSFTRLFAECIDKNHFDSSRETIVEVQAFEQVVSRFEQYLEIQCKVTHNQCLGLLIHDNNETVSKKHTLLMKEFHKVGTFWTDITQIIETPLFVNSELTSMIQIADLCSYALRRYLENGEEYLFELIFQRADRKDGIAVGVRHFTNQPCPCRICIEHRKPQ